MDAPEHQTDPVRPLKAPSRDAQPRPRRNRASAKAAGARFERQIADHLASTLDDRIDRRAKTGAKDRGDIGGLRHYGHRIVIECKNATRLNLPEWKREADIEAGNDDALVGIICHKRHGTADPGTQWVTMTLDDLIALLTAAPKEH